MGGDFEPQREVLPPAVPQSAIAGDVWGPPVIAPLGPPPPPPPGDPHKAFWKSPLKVGSLVVAAVVVAVLAVAILRPNDETEPARAARNSDSLLDDFGVDKEFAGSTGTADVSSALDASGVQVVRGVGLERNENRVVSSFGAPESKYLTASMCGEVSRVDNLDIVGFEQFEGDSSREQGFVGFGVGDSDELHAWAEEPLRLAEVLKSDPDNCEMSEDGSGELVGEPVVEMEATDDSVAVLVVFRIEENGALTQAGFVIVQHGDWAFLAFVADAGEMAPVGEFEDAVRLIAQDAVEAIQR